MSDLINRQAAIQAVMTDVRTERTQCLLHANMICKRLEDLPSAEPEIIRCKDCKFSKAYYHGSESNLGMFTYLCTQGLYGMNADDYCSRAERKDNG